MVSLLVALLRVRRINSYGILWSKRFGMARPTSQSPAEGWREYKRCFYIETLLTDCKALWRVARIAIAAIVNTFSHAFTRYRRLTRSYADTSYRLSRVQGPIFLSLSSAFLNSDLAYVFSTKIYRSLNARRKIIPSYLNNILRMIE